MRNIGKECIKILRGKGLAQDFGRVSRRTCLGKPLRDPPMAGGSPKRTCSFHGLGGELPFAAAWIDALIAQIATFAKSGLARNATDVNGPNLPFVPLIVTMALHTQTGHW